MQSYNTQTSVIEEIRKGDPQYLRRCYERYRREFIQWVQKHYKVDEESTTEIYQRTFIAFYYNIKEGKLKTMTSSEKTYLFAIGKNLLREHFRAAARLAEPLEAQVDLEDTSINILDQYEQDDQKKLAAQLLSEIGEPCRTVLELFYYQDKSLREIAEVMKYKTEQIAAKRKFICLQQLRARMSPNLN